MSDEKTVEEEKVEEAQPEQEATPPQIEVERLKVEEGGTEGVWRPPPPVQEEGGGTEGAWRPAPGQGE